MTNLNQHLRTLRNPKNINSNSALRARKLLAKELKNTNRSAASEAEGYAKFFRTQLLQEHKGNLSNILDVFFGPHQTM